MEYKDCVCCGQKTLDASIKFFDYCPVCGWQDDPIQNKDPDFWGGANLISLNEAKQVVADGKDLWAYRKAAKQRNREHKKQIEDGTAQEPLTAFG